MTAERRAVDATAHATGLAAASARVRRYLRFLGCARASVDDLAQETMLAAVRHFAGEVPPLPWLLTTARHAFGMHLRRNGRRREVHDLTRLHQMWSEQAGDDAGEARRLALRACLEQLPERSRAAIELRYGDGAGRAAIAAKVGIGEEGVKSLLARVRAALGDCVQRRLGRE